MATLYIEKLAGSAQAERMGIDLFLTDEHIELLKGIMTWKKVKAGVSLFMEGEEAGQLYYIRSGRVKLRKSTEDGKELMLTIQRRGDLIGEFGGLGGEEYNYTAETADACEIGVFQGKELEGLLSRHGDLAVQFVKWFALKQRIMESRFRDLLLYGKTGALASTLIRAVNTCGIKNEDGILLNIKLNHTELGEMIGATRESVNRMLTSLKEQGTIEMKEGKINILQLGDLRLMCCCPEQGHCSNEICRL
ncbi:Crp/Fnr family transcriptional regulator [Paenibacillus sp. P96]|uniref:Crp/Fnr family transcriptional regulator n=1 Tax=Paenibacillus zeirhizosphaerae TaxID=2987519 RepID=A0ABT9FMU6_9BACL|nr:Crp/Fnr family transcriptional regulator [Paenibacillus sp. P96]MDP4096061.1 Crp/Fnr family transcriptional regulator [Paenibacillus sp. P96]